MAKHGKFERDLENMDKKALFKLRDEKIKEFVDPATDDVRAADLMDELGTIDSKLMDG